VYAVVAQLETFRPCYQFYEVPEIKRFLENLKILEENERYLKGTLLPMKKTSTMSSSRKSQFTRKMSGLFK